MHSNTTAFFIFLLTTPFLNKHFLNQHLPEYMWVHAKKIGDGLEVYISEDSFDWMQIRQGDITDDGILQIGLYGASPCSEDGFVVTFEDFMIKGEEN